MAGRIWETMFQADPLNKQAGQNYLNKFLVHGGSRTPRDIYRDLLGEEVDIEKLADSLVKYHV